MECFFLKTSTMLSYHDKYLIKLGFYLVLTLLIIDCSVAISAPNPPDNSKDVEIKISERTDNGSLSTDKPVCKHPGTVQNENCETNPIHKNGTANISTNTSPKNNNPDVSTNHNNSHVTSINTAKHQCNNNTRDCHAESNNKSPWTGKVNEIVPKDSSKEVIVQTNKISTTESSEIASMTDHVHKYTGGLDVDEKLINSTNNNVNSSVDSRSDLNKTNLLKNVTHQKTNKTATNYWSTTTLQNSDTNTKQAWSTKAGGIAAGICLAVSSLAYISLMVWRKFSYYRYSNREMLINEDDLGDIHDEDMRHFEAACIQIET